MLRIFPLLLWCSDAPSRMRRLVQSYVELTHGSRESVESALVMANAFLGVFYGKAKDDVISGAQTIDVMPLHTVNARNILSGQYTLKEPAQLAPTGSAFQVLECALWAFAKTDTFEDGLNLVLSLDDTSNDAATVYGTIAGTFYGVAAIPEKWRTAYLGDDAWSVDDHVADLILGWGRRAGH